MKRLVYFLAVITLYSCENSSSSTKNYREGEVMLGFDQLITVDTVFAVVNYFNHKILKSGAFPQKVSYPKDSLGTLTSLLQSKNYLTFYGFSPSYDSLRSTINFYPYFVDVDIADQLDWKKMSDSLQFDTLSVYHPKYALIQVPIGDENYWISIYESRPYITFAELNYILHTTD